jgi:hypothetical protein
VTAPPTSVGATVWTRCPDCGHAGATVVTAELVRCLGRFLSSDTGRWCACLTEYRPI